MYVIVRRVGCYSCLLGWVLWCGGLWVDNVWCFDLFGWLVFGGFGGFKLLASLLWLLVAGCFNVMVAGSGVYCD